MPFTLLSLVLVYSALAATASATKLPRGEVLQGDGRSLTAQWTTPDYTMYHRKDELLQEVQKIVAANRKTFGIEMRNASDGDYSVQMMVVTVDLEGLDSSKAPKTRFLIDFGEHARELISSELGLTLLRTLADPKAIQAVLGGGQRGEALYRLVKEGVAFKILPMENTRGRDLLEKEGRLCERKNGRGVDPNRNWEVDWGKKEKDYDPNEEYPGTKPFSEPEVQIVLDLAQTFKPHAWLNIHSGMEAMFTPWDHQDKVPDAAQEALAVLKTIQRELFTTHKDCVVGSGGKSVGYLAHGTATDYMFEKLKVPLPYTWEIFGDFQVDYHDCFKMFNPVTKAQFDETISVWLKAIFRLIELAPSHTAVAAQLSAAKLAAQRTREQEKQQEQSQGPGPEVPDAEQSSGEPRLAVVFSVTSGSFHTLSTWVLLGLGLAGLGGLVYGAMRYLKSSASDSLASLGRRARTTPPV